MCYEFSQWFYKARAKDMARKEQPKGEQVVQKPQPAPAPEPASAEERVKERTPAPA